MAFVRSPMDLPIQGPLLPLTVSLGEIAKELKDKLVDTLVEKLIDKSFEAAGHVLTGAPPESGGFVSRELASLRNRDPNVEDVEQRRDAYIKVLALYYWPWLQIKIPQLMQLEKVLAPAIKKADHALLSQIRARAPLFIQNAGRLLALEKISGQRGVEWRVLRKGVKKLLFEEAKRYYTWRGTLLEVRVAPFMSGPNIDKEFIVFVENRRDIHLRGDFSLTVLHRQDQ